MLVRGQPGSYTSQTGLHPSADVPGEFSVCREPLYALLLVQSQLFLNGHLSAGGNRPREETQGQTQGRTSVPELAGGRTRARTVDK